MNATSRLTKVAVVRAQGYKIGNPAPLHLNCPCGAKPVTALCVSVVKCSCGARYTGDGHVLSLGGWAMRSVGCHWTHPNYPSAVVSTFTRGNPGAGQMKSGYGAWINYELIGEFETRELAQQAVEALLDGNL